MINKFQDKYYWLSNFSPFPFITDNNKWESVEHFFQAHKACNPKDFLEIKNAKNPSIAKKLGKQVEIRCDWPNIKLKIMLKGVREKFDQNPILIEKLIETGNKEIIEGNYWHDNYWGNCYCDKCLSIKGKNKLGKILMLLRAKYIRKFRERNDRK
jgi:ribA/ribD-fused uncharacterized protein